MDQKIKLIPALLENVTWQYDGDLSLRSLITKKQEWYTVNWANYWDNWHASVFDLKTANRFGCVVWAIILGLPVGLVYDPNSIGDTLPIGFGSYRQNFNNANFYGTSDTPALSLEEARKLLRIRYYSQTMSTTIFNINGMLHDVFAEDGLAYMEETVGGVTVTPFGFGPFNQNFNSPTNFNNEALFGNLRAMAQKYVFTFPLTDNFKEALQQYLPRGSGVQTLISSPSV